MADLVQEASFYLFVAVEANYLGSIGLFAVFALAVITTLPKVLQLTL